jgi:cytochrome c oxidase subunit 2
VANVYLVDRTAPPKPSSTALTVDVIGHQWWWEVRYPGTSAVTANEIHIPVNTRVNVVATTADVIHSFWVPALNRKIDMIPGLHNRVLLYSSRTGKFRGQCSQFCGLQHAHMSFWVFVDTPEAFRSWLAHTAAPASAPRSAAARAGQRVFMTSACASCHEIRGTGSTATVGPDLTHIAGRTSIAALTLPTTPSALAAWIHNPQAIKPGDRMPDLGLGSSQVSELVSYLEGLR